eukprot:GILI01005911.1.p1 GENE.GILI01005911.1~~GILI01005911.1.p1  ORF type:complete len:213 (-),score=50.38 GILI01005911.1:711-1349(-)
MASKSQRGSTKAEPNFDHFIKLLLLGDSGVGKSSLMMRFSEDQFYPNLMGTAGVDFKVRYVDIDGKRIKMQIWDTAGQERFHTITKAYYRGAMGIVLVYDVTDQKTFDNVDYWMDNIRKHGNETVEKILVGNKIDLANRMIEEERGRELASRHQVPFMETSAKSAERVEDAFVTIARAVISRQMSQAPAAPEPTGVKLSAENGSGHKKGGCC